jgi:hypothetical protein
MTPRPTPPQSIWSCVRFLGRLSILALALALLLSSALLAQEGQPGQQGHEGMDMHEHPTEPAPPAPLPPTTEPAHHGDHAAPESGGEHSGMPGMAGMHGHAMSAFLGPYAMTREASGTSWQPESAPHRGYHFSVGPWQMMAHGMLTIALDHQSGRRGSETTFSSNMAMVMGSRAAGEGRVGFRAMVSAEPWTIGARGYPLLLQTGETADGVHPLVDRQHPHDLLMEIAGTYSRPLGGSGSWGYVYLGLPGEPALGPTAYMHRTSGMENPETPISHHWLDSTHISYGVATLGWIRDDWKVEGSLFNGREPDQHRTDVEIHALDSYAARLSWQPSPDWSFQVSSGRLRSPEQLEPEVDVTRTTASGVYNQRLANAGNFQATLAWGRNAKSFGHTLDAFLFEAAVSPTDHQTAFVRLEHVAEDELFTREPASPLAGRIFQVAKLGVGYVRDLLTGGPGGLRLGLGAMADVSFVPSALEPAYGTAPISYLIFLRLRN